MHKTIMACCIIAAAGWLGFSSQPRVVSSELTLHRIQTDAARNWPAEKFRGCPNITYHVPTVPIADQALWDQSLRDAAKQWQQAAQRKEAPCPWWNPDCVTLAAQRKERPPPQPRPPRLTDEQCRQFDIAYFDARKAGLRYGRE